ncbi:acetyl-CoA synthetase-like protein [Neolentinus lepideus HHB14362 ss-1]|uniref:Acetyl-CoA synthetase-like protein n=1 Tax=Neolentinus lepideus HHB14362 ss-1 TaxID=1314782 RepID=A0A165W122_9AGAM|nr:acetyl-CoA synthetase-like protein [Neolentinus lepideus HHB14362 ss-1]
MGHDLVNFIEWSHLGTAFPLSAVSARRFGCDLWGYPKLATSWKQYPTATDSPLVRNLCRSHLSILETSASIYASSPAFRIPVIDSTGAVSQWTSITYLQFLRDLERFAGYWRSVLRSSGIPPKSVVGLWLGGMTYTDVLHIYGLARAGYIPQLFSLRLPNPDVVFELLHKGHAKALIYDASFASTLSDNSIPTFVAAAESQIPASAEPLPELSQPSSGNDLAFIFHTSGSTSGSPKLVPCTYIWLNTIIEKARQVSQPANPSRQDVSTWMGSMCHIGQTFMLIGSLQHGSCTIQPTKISFSSEELVDMVLRCNLNRLHQFATFLGIHLRNSRLNPKLVAILRSMDQVVYSGLPLPREEEDWALNSGLRLANLFGNTECGAMLLSVGGTGPFRHSLRPLEGVSYGFLPIAPKSQNEAGHQSVNTNLLELVILRDSGDCPDVSLRHADGHFHTGDLFLEVQPGCYVSRGRDDDWIKSENSLRCDTKAIEDNVRAMCGGLISECIVVGNGRPSPALFIEPASIDMDHTKLKKEILRKTRQFHARRYLHERITSPSFIIIVPSNTLPRTATKGNIRRRAVEEQFKTHLDKLYAATA